MRIRDQIMRTAAGNPEVRNAVDSAERQLATTPIMPDDLKEAIILLEFVLKNPDKYSEVLQAALKDGIVDDSMMPKEFNQAFIISFLIALYEIQDRASQKMARGGIAHSARHLASLGRGGDTELAHVNPREAEMLKRMGGSGTVNPNTGLREYKFLGAIGKILKVVAPIALTLIPGIGTAVGGALTGGLLGEAGSAIVGGAALGAGSSALTGGNVAQGAILGGLGGGLGSVVGDTVNTALGTDMGAATQNLVGSGLVGGLSGVVTGKGFQEGATQGVLGGAIGNLANPAATGILGKGLSAAATMGGNALTAGYTPEQALTSAATAGLGSAAMTGLSAKPSDAVVNNVSQEGASSTPGLAWKPGDTFPQPVSVQSGVRGASDYTLTDSAPSVQSGVRGASDYTLTDAAPGITVGNGLQGVASTAPVAPVAPVAPSKSVLGGLGQYVLPAALAYSVLGSAPKEVQDAVPALSTSQQEYFNRPSITWNWNKLQQDAASSGQSLGQYMSRNWDKVSGGAYNNPTTVTAARGGALTEIANYARGSGSGRDDTINAKLSNGEYVMDAETVALLGDGSSEEGARRLDAMRNNIREHKGRSLAKGKISPNAKAPLSYLKGVK